MSQIKLQPAEAREHAGRITRSAETSQTEFRDLRTYLNGLKSAFEGQTATQFEAQYDDWNNHATKMVEALDGLGKFLREAANAIEELDTDMASKLKSS